MSTLAPPSADDPLFRLADQVPLGRPLGLVDAIESTPSRPAVRPFGLRFTRRPKVQETIDLSALRYDPHRQLSIDGTGTPVYGKHSTGTTNTRTSDGHQSMDSDTDHTED